MKARLLQKLLETDRTVHCRDGKVCIASALCSELISYDPKTKTIRYALDTFREGRESIQSDELGAIWDKLESIVKSGQIDDIISGNDDTDGMIPVFEASYGEVYEEMTDKIGWPNVTHTGKLMYNNTHFDTFEKAAKRSIAEAESSIKCYAERIKEKRAEVERMNKEVDFLQEKVTELKNQFEVVEDEERKG